MAKTSPSGVLALLDALERAPELIVPLVREMDPSLRTRTPAPGKWSVHQHSVHLSEVHELFTNRLDLMLADETPAITPYDPTLDGADSRLLATDLDEALDRFRIDRARLVARLRDLTPEQWARTATHAEYRVYSVFVMFRHLALHDFLHGYRIEELVLRPGWE